MTIEKLAQLVVAACEEVAVDHMVTGAFATGYYGIPRSTKDVDVVVSVASGTEIASIVDQLSPEVAFDPQIQFDTLTWGRRQVGVCKGSVPFKVELFELFNDPFVQEQFARRKRLFSQLLKRTTWLPTAEDVIVQKLRWGRSKDLDDARDVLIVQSVDKLDMPYIESWCERHGTTERLRAVLDSIPPI